MPTPPNYKLIVQLERCVEKLTLPKSGSELQRYSYWRRDP